jgi:hypothetical protein
MSLTVHSTLCDPLMVIEITLNIYPKSYFYSPNLEAILIKLIPCH